MQHQDQHFCADVVYCWLNFRNRTPSCLLGIQSRVKFEILEFTRWESRQSVHYFFWYPMCWMQSCVVKFQDMPFILYPYLLQCVGQSLSRRSLEKDAWFLQMNQKCKEHTVADFDFPGLIVRTNLPHKTCQWRT